MKIHLPLIALMLFGCAAESPDTAGTEIMTESVEELPRDVHWMRNSAEHRAILLQTYRAAGERLVVLTADKEPGTWAVASDADETLIDNSGYSKELALANRQPSDAGWDEWVRRREAPPLPGALEFLELVRSLGGRIAVVTNRIDDHCPDTKVNFENYGIPFDVMLCRTEARDKEPRWELVEQGEASADLPPLEIVMWLGDNIGDFPDLDQGLRNRGPEAFVGFGDRFFAFPNPSYGSWEDNPYD